MLSRSTVGWIFIATLSLTLVTIEAAEIQPLPEPLTLEAALLAIDDNHPEILLASGQEQNAIAASMEAASNDDLQINFSLQGRYVETNSISSYQDHDDSRAILTLNKTLYDFGRTRHAITSEDHSIKAQKLHKKLVRQQLQQSIMQTYFNVLLSDLESARATEAMAIAFIRSDKTKDRLELGEVSDIEALEAEDQYQISLLDRTRADEEQRNTRARLALTLNRPDNLSDTLIPPALPGNMSELPGYSTLHEEAKSNNLTLQHLQQELAALQEKRKADRAHRNPTLYLSLQAAEYQRETSSRDPFTAVLGLDIPLYQGKRVDAATAHSDAEIQLLKAQITQSQYNLRQQVLTQWQHIRTLMLQKKQANIRNDYRDLYLDRSRARYELELATDFGDAMVQQSAARLFTAETDYDLALAREKLVELTGNMSYSGLSTPVNPAPVEESTKNTPAEESR